MTLVEGEELQRLWSLVSELSSQLSANRELCQSLQAQADELKGQALHTGTGYALRRFNLDISKHQFESELEKLNSQLVIENQSLSHENKQITMLLREYEGTLESVMSKFRSFSHATQQHTLQLTSHYETLLANDAYQNESASLHASTSYSNTLAHLGGLVRLALREVEGEGAADAEDEDDEVSGQGADDGIGDMSRGSDPFEAEGYKVGTPSGGATSSAQIGGKQQTRKARTGYGSAPSRDPRWYGTGGYTGLQGDPEAEKASRALEARSEEERLRKENEVLREMLRISADVTPEVAREFGIELPSATAGADWAKASSKLSLGKPRASRKSIDGGVAADKASSSAAASISASTEGDGQTVGKEEEDGAAEEGGDRPAQLAEVEEEDIEEHPAPDSQFEDVKDDSRPFVQLQEGAGGPPQLGHGSLGADILGESASATAPATAAEDADAISSTDVEASGEAIEETETDEVEESGDTTVTEDTSPSDPTATDAASTTRDRLLDEVEESIEGQALL